jgi:hypothetical protein
VCLGEGQRPQGTLRVVPRLSPPRRLCRHSPTALLVRRHGAEALVEVLDSGCVAEEEIPRLFDRFHRAAAPDIEGNGLGSQSPSRSRDVMTWRLGLKTAPIARACASPCLEGPPRER